MLRLRPYTIVTVYALASALWILLSDKAVGVFFSDSVETLTRISTFKGWLYVAIMSGLLLGMLKRFQWEIVQQQQATSESEEQYRALFDGAGDAIFIVDDATMRFVKVNDTACQRLGYTESEFLTMTPRDLDAQEDAPQVIDRLEQLRKHGVLVFEVTFVAKDGSRIPVEVSARMLLYQGRPAHISTARDISDRKQAEAALRASEEKYHNVISNMTDVYYRTDALGKLTMVSPSGVAMFGHGSEEEILGLPIESFWMDPAQRIHLLSMLQKDDMVRDYEVLVKRRDGSPLHVSTSSRVLRSESGEVLGVEGIFRDITERKLAEKALLESEERLRIIADNTLDWEGWRSPEGKSLWVSPSCERITGYSPKELTGEGAITMGTLIHPEDKHLWVEHLHAFEAQQPEHQELEFRIIQKNGGVIWIGHTCKPIYDSKGTFLGRRGCNRDITERKRAVTAMLESEKRFRRIVETACEGIIAIDDNRAITYCNKVMADILGYSEEELLQLNFVALFFVEDLPLLKVEGERRRQGITSRFERRFRRKDGTELWTDFAGTPVFDDSGVYKGSFGMVTDITERKQLQEQLLFRAMHDPLTGLANRTLCMDRIDQAKERANRKPENTFAVVFIDLDGFKAINDSLGHEAGDTVLKHVAKRLLTCARRIDTVCRYGGDEFILVLEGVTPREAIRAVKRVRLALDIPIPIGNQELHVAASYGIAYAPQENCQSEDLLRNANIALHQAKRLGRDRMVAYRKDMHEAAINTLSLQGDMRRGLNANEFFMVYQPIFHLANNRLAGFEALIRWNHPQRGTIGPYEFIPMAEESGFIYELGNFALQQSCKDMVGLLLDLPSEEHLTVSVNLSPRQLSRQGLADQIEQTLVTTGLPPSTLVLEITESSIMRYPEASAHILARLKEKGVGIAIDDFGTGYSSLSALQKLPLDRMKIDMSFVRRMTDNEQDREIVRAIIALAHGLGLKTVAEGIETEQQRETLRKMHCDLGQGYLCSRPMLLADVPKAIRLRVCTPPAE